MAIGRERGMGQHKYNQTALEAKAGKLPPKPSRMGKRAADRLIAAMIAEETGLNRIKQAMGGESYG